jgi:hypothetical protein
VSRSGTRSRFGGRIAGIGTTSGVRVVVGRWTDTPLVPFGGSAFADAMIETADGHRILLAPSQDVVDLLIATYNFDETRIEPFDVTDTARGSEGGWQVRSASLILDLTFGDRSGLGRLLRLVPGRIAATPAWCVITDPVARLAVKGVRTRGTAGHGRREWYGATDAHRVTGASGTFDGAPLGDLAAVLPPPRFGFSAPPPTPTVTTVVTTIEG